MMTHGSRAAKRLSPRLVDRLRNDAGFTIIESAVGIVLASIIIIGLTQTLFASLDGLADSRKQEQATVLALEAVEYARSVPFVELGLDVKPDATDPNTLGGSKLKGSLFGLPTDEHIIFGGSGIVPYKVVETLDDEDFTIYSYVTRIVNSELSRVVVVVEYLETGATRSHHTSTLISEVSSP